MANFAVDADAPSEAETPSSGFNPLQVLARRWQFLAVGLVIGSIIGVLLHSTSPPQYQSSAQVLVIKKRTEMLKDGDIRVAAVEDYIATQVTLIKSEKIRLLAAQKARTMPNASDLPADDYALASMIASGLTVSRDKDAGGSSSVGSGVLNLTFRGSDPEMCKRLLDAVIKAHQAELYAIYDQQGQELVASLDRTIKNLEKQNEQAGQERNEKKEALGKFTSEDVSKIRARVSDAQDKKRAIKLETLELDDQIALIAEAGDNPQKRQLVLAQLGARFRLNSSAAPGAVSGPAGVSALNSGEPTGFKAVLRSLEKQRRDLLTNVGLGKDHPRVLALDEQIAELKAEMSIPVMEPVIDVPMTVRAPDELESYLKSLKQQKMTLDRKFALIESQIKDDEKLLLSAGGLQDRIDTLNAQIAQYEAELKKHRADRVTTMSTQGGSGYGTEPITPPGYGYNIGPVLLRSMLTGIGLGVLLGVGMMLLAEVSDKSFRSPAEIRQRLGLPIVGHIPHIRVAAASTDDSHEDFDPVLVTAVRPKSSESEAYRGLRTQLYFSTQGRGHQVIQVTSPSPGDGKSTLAANLAISIAQSGKRTILIDCDLRKPRVHKLFGVESELGLAGVITGTELLDDAIMHSGIEHLDLLPCGTRPANPAELLGGPQFQQLITDLRARYDFVIIDTPPLLAVTDPAVVAPRVDGVLLVFQMTKKVRPAAERAREVLAGVGANALGVVVNAAATGMRGYGYGYTYGYGYGYTYSYGYKYSDYNYSDGYHDDHDDREEVEAPLPRKG